MCDVYHCFNCDTDISYDDIRLQCPDCLSVYIRSRKPKITVYCLMALECQDGWILGSFSTITEANKYLQKNGIDDEFTEEKDCIVYYANPYGLATTYILQRTIVDSLELPMRGY